MSPLVVQSCDKTTQRFGSNGDAATHPLGPRHIDLIDVNDQLMAIPVQTARTNLVVVRASMDVLTAALRHGPTLAALAIQSHIQCAIVFWIGHPTLKASRQRVVRRKNAPYKSNDGQTMFAIVTQRIDIPPEITTRRDGLVKPRSAISVAAASRPDMAAIGTPGPG